VSRISEQLNRLFGQYAAAVEAGRADTAEDLQAAMLPLCTALCRPIRRQYPSARIAQGDRFDDVIVDKFLTLTRPDRLRRIQNGNFAAYFWKAVQNGMLQAAPLRPRDRVSEPISDVDGLVEESLPGRSASPDAALSSDLRRQLLASLSRLRPQVLESYCDYLELAHAAGAAPGIEEVAARRRIPFTTALNRVRTAQRLVNGRVKLAREWFEHGPRELGDLAELIPELRALIDEQRRGGHAGRLDRGGEPARQR
jgi:hypothetical protein